MRIFRTFLHIVTLLLAAEGYSQYTFTSYNHEYFKKFLTTETIVPITGIHHLDSIINETLQDNWRFTPLRFVPKEKINQISKRENVSILNLFSFEMDETFGNTSLCLFLPDDINETRMTNIIASVPIKCGFWRNKEFGSECGFEEIGYKINILLIQLIEVVEFTRNSKYVPTFAHTSGINKYLKKFNLNSLFSKYENGLKTLLVSDADLNSSFDSEQFKKYYKNQVKIVSEKDFEDILASDNRNYLVLLRSNTPNTMISVFDLEKRKTLYIALSVVKHPVSSTSKIFAINRKLVKGLNKHLKKLSTVNKVQNNFP